MIRSHSSTHMDNHVSKMLKKFTKGYLQCDSMYVKLRVDKIKLNCIRIHTRWKKIKLNGQIDLTHQSTFILLYGSLSNIDHQR